MFFEKEYYDKLKIYNADNIYQFNINNQFIANLFKNLNNWVNKL